MAELSDWYRAHWDGCATNSDPAACSSPIGFLLQPSAFSLRNVLAAMNGQPKSEQKKMYQQMRLNNRLMF